MNEEIYRQAIKYRLNMVNGHFMGLIFTAGIKSYRSPEMLLESATKKIRTQAFF